MKTLLFIILSFLFTGSYGQLHSNYFKYYKSIRDSLPHQVIHVDTVSNTFVRRIKRHHLQDNSVHIKDNLISYNDTLGCWLLYPINEAWIRMPLQFIKDK